MRKKLGSVVVEFMLQELGFHVAHVQPGSYHIYERDPAGDEDLHLGSPGDPVPINKYVLLREGVIPFFSRMVLSSVMV